MKKLLLALLTIQSALAMQPLAQEKADSLLSTSLLSNDVDLLKKAIAAGANVNSIPQEDNPPLLAALFYKADTSLIKTLLNHNADPNYSKNYGVSSKNQCHNIYTGNCRSSVEQRELAEKYLFLMDEYLQLKKQAENNPSTELLRKLIIKNTKVDLSDLIFIILQSNQLLYVTEEDINLAQDYHHENADASIKRSLVNYKKHFDTFMKQFATNNPYSYLPEEIINNIVSFL
jgi:hypothetical protein